ncbi:MAG TPA: prolyl oligopeptidase family serine peptidase [Steroidobacteraceae bacterium]|nr:prolyl oligopeptidase family serine peptidase [Steroidobacteraceae bacterium]
MYVNLVRSLVRAALLCTLVISGAHAATHDPEIVYPSAMRGAHVDVYHGVRVADPYRWMEDIDSPATRAWVAAESKLSRGYLDAIPGRQEIHDRLRRIWNYERWSPPEHYGRYWFYSHNDGLQNQSVLYVATDPDAKPRLLLDPNTLSRDGTIALRETAISDDGRLFAYALSDAGSDWQTWHVRDVATGKDLPDALKWSKAGGGSWRKDHTGFYYTRYSAPSSGEALKAANQYEKLYFHRLGTPQSSDVLVYTRRDNPDWFVGGQVTDDGRYLVITANFGDQVQNTLLVQHLAERSRGSGLAGDGPVIAIIPKPTSIYTFIGNVGTMFYLLTDDEAPRNRIIAIDLAHPERAKWRTVVPESKDTLDTVSLVGHQLIAEYLHDAHSAVRRYSLAGQLLGEVALDGLGTASGFQGHIDDTTTYYSFSSFTQPPSIYRLDLRGGTGGAGGAGGGLAAAGSTAGALWRQPFLNGFTPGDYETRQIFYRSKDGTRVPLYLVSRKGTKQDGSNPTILYGYGGFDISLEPAFSPRIAGWLQLGGVYAMANIRGGGEYGRAWHEAGMKMHKQNVFDDFIAAAKYLIAQRWTSPARLAIWGASNGGLLVGATEEQAPELFAAAVPQVGVMDMLRFAAFTVGKGWESDYGSVNDPEQFRALLAYSPLQNVKEGVNYPATLIMTGDHDDRVFPAHSFKFAAAMQHADPRGRPILLRVETRAGHGSGKPTSKLIEETTDMFAFVLNAMHLAGTAPVAAR